MSTRSIIENDRTPVFGGVAAAGLLIVTIALALAGFVGPALGAESTVTDAGPPIAAIGVLIAGFATIRFD